MSFVSYLEDIIAKSEEYEHYLEKINLENEQKIDIHKILHFRKDCLRLLEDVKKIGGTESVFEKHIQIQGELRVLKNQNEKLKPIAENSKKEISNLEEKNRKLKEEKEHYKRKCMEFQQAQKAEIENRQEYESMMDERWRLIYQNKLDISNRKISELQFEIYELSKLLTHSSPNDAQLYSNIKFKLNNLMEMC